MLLNAMSTVKKQLKYLINNNNSILRALWETDLLTTHCLLVIYSQRRKKMVKNQLLMITSWMQIIWKIVFIRYIYI